MSKKLCQNLWDGFNKVAAARSNLQGLLDNSDETGLEVAQIKSAVEDFKEHRDNYSKLLLSLAKLNDRTPINATDYLALCKLASDNNLPDSDILIRFNSNNINSVGRVSSIVINNCGLSDISALAHLKSLNMIFLPQGKITDLHPIKKLTALTSLTLSDNQLVDISPIQNLTALTELYLHRNRITDISPIKNLPVFNAEDVAFNVKFNPLSEASKALLEARRIP